MQGGDSYFNTATSIIDRLKEGKAHVYDLIKEFADGYNIQESFVRSACEGFVSKKIAVKEGERMEETYELIEFDDNKIEQVLNDMFGDGEMMSREVKDYFQQYGFNELIKSVARQIDHNDTIVREFDEDRLWIGRFVDFLDKAKEWIAFKEADQAIAKKKISKLKQQYSAKSKGI